MNLLKPINRWRTVALSFSGCSKGSIQGGREGIGSHIPSGILKEVDKERNPGNFLEVPPDRSRMVQTIFS